MQADLHITLSEALTGFNRVVLTHLDGRGIALNVQQPKGRVLRPGEVIKVKGEGMPIKKSDNKGDLYLTLEIAFPEDGWLKDDATMQQIRGILPKPEEPTKTDTVDEVQWEVCTNMDEFGAGSGGPRGAEWEDEDGEEGEAAQCAQQ